MASLPITVLQKRRVKMFRFLILLVISTQVNSLNVVDFDKVSQFASSLYEDLDGVPFEKDTLPVVKKAVDEIANLNKGQVLLSATFEDSKVKAKAEQFVNCWKLIDSNYRVMKSLLSSGNSDGYGQQADAFIKTVTETGGEGESLLSCPDTIKTTMSGDTPEDEFLSLVAKALEEVENPYPKLLDAYHLMAGTELQNYVMLEFGHVLQDFRQRTATSVDRREFKEKLEEHMKFYAESYDAATEMLD